MYLLAEDFENFFESFYLPSLYAEKIGF